MRQWTFSEFALLSALMPSLKAAMRAAAGDRNGEGRKSLVDTMNGIASQANIKLTGGNGKGLSKDSLDKILAPADVNHPPSILFLAVLCKATDNFEPMRVLLESLGLGIMTSQDKQDAAYGRAVREEKEARQRRKKLER